MRHPKRPSAWPTGPRRLRPGRRRWQPASRGIGGWLPGAGRAAGPAKPGAAAEGLKTVAQRELPAFVEGYGPLRPYDGPIAPPARVVRTTTSLRTHLRGQDKLLAGIDAAFAACGIADGATLSFHHHLRNGDQVLNQVLEVAARRGLRDLTIAPSSIFPVHAPLVGHLRSGVVRRIVTAYMSGPVAQAVSRGVLPVPVVMSTHGDRRTSSARRRVGTGHGGATRRRGVDGAGRRGGRVPRWPGHRRDSRACSMNPRGAGARSGHRRRPAVLSARGGVLRPACRRSGVRGGGRSGRPPTASPRCRRSPSPGSTARRRCRAPARASRPPPGARRIRRAAGAPTRRP